MINIMLRIFIIVLAVVVVLAGLITLPLPIPVGLVLIALGLTMLIASSIYARRTVRYYRSEYATFDEVMRKMEGLAPARIRKMLMKTKPRR